MNPQKTMHVQGPQINQFNNIAENKIPRSAFKRDHSLRTTFNQDYLVPMYLDEILPGDDVNIKMTAFTRMSTPIKPLMDNLYMETFWFFVPNRLAWVNWERLQGEQVNPGDSTAYTVPVLDVTKAPLATTGFTENTIYDYFGLPIKVTKLGNVSALFNRAYDLIWNDWFRDENLQNSVATQENSDGPDDPGIYALRKRNKRKDYFTSALPWPQKGDPVSISLASTAPVTRTNNAIAWGVYQHATNIAAFAGNDTFTNGGGVSYLTDSSGATTSLDPRGGLVADLSAASAITINALRQAALYQQILELDARGGTRYVESLYSRFGVISPDFRLQRPELIGQGSTRINIYSVPQTAPTTGGSTPQGNLAAFGTGLISGDHGCRYSATEHGMLIGLVNVRADLTYQQGLPKMFSRRTRLDFYEPLLNGLGEQAVLNKEIFAQGNDVAPLGVITDNQPFGYQERFSEYRFKNSVITGLFRSTATGTIDIWHLSQKFAALPGLNSAFITENVPMARVLAVNTEPSFLMDASFSVNHVRPMPIRSNPGIDRL